MLHSLQRYYQWWYLLTGRAHAVRFASSCLVFVFVSFVLSCLVSSSSSSCLRFGVRVFAEKLLRCLVFCMDPSLDTYMNPFRDPFFWCFLWIRLIDLFCVFVCACVSSMCACVSVNERCWLWATTFTTKCFDCFLTALKLRFKHHCHIPHVKH